MRRLRLTALVLAVGLGSGACGTGANDQAAASSGGAIVPASATKLRSAIKSKRPLPVVVNYWATWCDPCKKEMPRFVDAAAKYKRRVAFVGVNVEDDAGAARRFARRYGIPFRSYAISRAEVQRAQDILGLPVTQFYRADGELAFVHQGEVSSDDLHDKIEELLDIGKPVAKP
ncbi:MAG TPA: TlpA disulfide reductase family protein [Actinomycetota bacterium]|nr:TlpA disulfide reductase family protein [Actinomycetota bacterium]